MYVGLPLHVWTLMRWGESITSCIGTANSGKSAERRGERWMRFQISSTTTCAMPFVFSTTTMKNLCP